MIQILVRAHETFVLDVLPDEAISFVKLLVQDRTGSWRDRQVLAFNTHITLQVLLRGWAFPELAPVAAYLEATGVAWSWAKGAASLWRDVVHNRDVRAPGTQTRMLVPHGVEFRDHSPNQADHLGRLDHASRRNPTPI